MAANLNLYDAVVSASGQTPLFGFAFGVLSGVVGFPDVAFKRILCEIVVRRANVGIAKDFFHQHERTVVVALRISTVNDDFYPVLFLKIEESFFLVTHHDNDVVDAGCLQLLDLALDKDIATYPQKPFWALVGDRSETRGETRCQDDRVVNGIGSESRHAFGSDAPVLDKFFGGAFFVSGVDRGET